MKNMKQKIKFTDIAGMLDRDQMREIIGGCGTSAGSGIDGTGGGGSFYGPSFGIVAPVSVSSVSSITPAGMTSFTSPSPSAGSINIQSVSTSSSSAGSSSSSSGTGSYGGYGGFSSWGAVGTSGSTYGGSGSSTYAGGGGGSIQNVNNNSGTGSNTYGGSIGSVNYNGVSFETFFPGGSIGIGSIEIGSIGSSLNSNYLPQGVPPTDCFFQCLGWISQMNGDTVHDANYYASVYAFTHPNTSVIPDFNLSNFNVPSTNGISLDQASAFAGVFFKATDYSGASNQFLSNWINPSTNPSGDRQLIGVYKTEVGGLHAIAVTSINGSTINFYDPQKGISDSRDMSKFVSFYGITNKP